jgi:cytosine/adenosine deaminase-related metal-dependent hydrolase
MTHFDFFASAVIFQLLLFYCISSAAQESILFDGAAAVISFNRQNETVQVLYNTSVLVTGNTIASIFPASQSAALPANTTRIPSQGKIITPGFIDTHHHLWQTAFKTLGSNTSLAEYFFRYGEFTQAQTVFTGNDVYLGQLTGIYESLNAGVTSILDHSHHTWSNETSLAGLQASVDSGARVWWSYAFHDLSNGFTREDQVNDFLYLSQNGPWRDSATVSLGIAYDNWSVDNDTLVNQTIYLAQ